MTAIKAPCGGIELDDATLKIVDEVITFVDSIATEFTTVVVCGGIKFDAEYFSNVNNVLTVADVSTLTTDNLLIGACGGIGVDNSYFSVVDGVMSIIPKELTVVSVDGSSSGDTAITVTPTLTTGRTYVYLTDTTVTLPVFGDDLSAWTSWDGVAEITAVTGDEIAIAEVLDGLCMAVGKTTVASLA